jgi:hypothetical protein
MQTKHPKTKEDPFASHPKQGVLTHPDQPVDAPQTDDPVHRRLCSSTIDKTGNKPKNCAAALKQGSILHVEQPRRALKRPSKTRLESSLH